MEIENVNSKANTGVALGSVGVGLGALSILGGHLFGFGNNGFNGGFGGSFNGGFATRYDLENVKELMAKDRQIAILTSEQNTEIKIADVYERIMTRVNADARAQAEWNANQNVNNSRLAAAIAKNSESISDINGVLRNITKIVVPKSAICPEVMPRYNSWTAPIVAEEETPTT